MLYQSCQFWITSILLVGFGCLPIVVNAQDRPTALDKISVVSTATRTEQRVEGVTASVVEIDAEEIEKSGVQTLKDVFNNTPGHMPATIEAAHIVKPMIASDGWTINSKNKYRRLTFYSPFR